jgi:PAS domain S-box-containing protein
MPKKSFAGKLASAHHRLVALQDEASLLPEAEGFATRLTELRDQLEELEVAHEELEQQNEELMEAREELERQRHRYRHLFEEAPFGYLVTDLQGRIEEANRMTAEMAGIPQSLFAGKPLSVFFSRESRSVFYGLLSRLGGGKAAGETEVLIKSRSREPFAAMLTGVRDPDAQEGGARLHWTVRDISQTREAEAALRSTEERLRHAQRLEAVGRLAGGIAHSFNNLLAAIAFQCELLCDAIDKEDPRRGHVEEIQHAGERAAALARQLLAYGRKQVLQPRLLRLDDVIGEMEPMLRRLIGEHIRLETRLAAGEGAVHVDLGQLEQVILNLTVNARDAMTSGGTLRLAAESVEIAAGEAADLPPGPYLRLTVEDTGSGMPPEVLGHLFEPFFTTKERGQGTGLGLATVHGIVHQSGGQIRVESEPGVGSRFLILFPRSAEVAEAGPVRFLRPARRARRGSEVVLLVEDEDNIRQPAVEILESRGYQVLAAPDAAQALTVANGHPGTIHILVTDVVMPGLSGNQLAQQLLRRRPGMRVLYISGYPEDSISHHGVLDLGQHFLQKPFPPGQFLEKVREVLDAGAASG